jgi:hypothetical protein
MRCGTTLARAPALHRPLPARPSGSPQATRTSAPRYRLLRQPAVGVEEVVLFAPKLPVCWYDGGWGWGAWLAMTPGMLGLWALVIWVIIALLQASVSGVPRRQQHRRGSCPSAFR